MILLMLWPSVGEEASLNPRSQKETEEGQGLGSHIRQKPKSLSVGSTLLRLYNFPLFQAGT